LGRHSSSGVPHRCTHLTATLRDTRCYTTSPRHRRCSDTVRNDTRRHHRRACASRQRSSGLPLPRARVGPATPSRRRKRDRADQPSPRGSTRTRRRTAHTRSSPLRRYSWDCSLRCGRGFGTPPDTPRSNTFGDVRSRIARHTVHTRGSGATRRGLTGGRRGVSTANREGLRTSDIRP
jgi:hypothetical protein